MIVTTTTAPPAAWLADLVARLVAELEDEGVTDPLAEPITLAAVLADLFRMIEAPVPASVATLVG